MKTVLPLFITTREEAESYIADLFKNGELYHFEDQAADIIWGDEQPTPEECDRLDQLAAQMFEIEDFDPFVLTLRLNGVECDAPPEVSVNAEDELKKLVHYEPKPEGVIEFERVNAEAALLRLAKVSDITKQIIDVMGEMGMTTWEEFEPFLAGVLFVNMNMKAKAASSEHSIPESHV